MKNALILLLATTVLASGQTVTVNGKRVDLTPLDAWLKNPVGERPLKHWQVIRVYDVQGNTSVWKKCSITGEAGWAEALVANLPPSVEEYQNTVKTQAAAIAQEEAVIAREEERLRNLGGPSPIDLTGGTIGAIRFRQWYIDHHIDVDRLRERQQGLLHSKSAYEATLNEAADKITVLAMFTGKKYQGLKIWDCGRR